MQCSGTARLVTSSSHHLRCRHLRHLLHRHRRLSEARTDSGSAGGASPAKHICRRCRPSSKLRTVIVDYAVCGSGMWTRSSTRLQSEFSTIFPSLMGFIMGKRYSVPIRNVRKPAIRKMSPMLKRYNAARSASISHCPLPLTFQIGAAGWNVGGIPTDGITPLFNDVTKALEVIPSKTKSPPFTLARMM